MGAVAEAAERRKHVANDPKCAELGWVCVPLAVGTYCNWGEEARHTFTVLATHPALDSSHHKARMINDMFGRLNFHPGESHRKAYCSYCRLLIK